MGGERNSAREARVRALARLAQTHGLQAIPENSGRGKVKKLAEDILALNVNHSESNADGAGCLHGNLPRREGMPSGSDCGRRRKHSSQ